MQYLKAFGRMARIALLSWLGSCSPAQQAASTPNIILVMADDQGWGDVGYNGHPVLQTPHLDEMADSGLRFDRFYAAAPVCSPTRGSVMTGRHPNRFGCFRWGHTLRPQEITIAEALRQAGYRTGHFGKWHLGSVRKGSPVNPGASGFDSWFSAPNFFDNNPILSEQGVAVQTSGESSQVVVTRALTFIRSCVAENRPFLAVVWFGSPHRPHKALRKDRQLYPDEPEPLQNYYGEITALDRAFGSLRREIGKLGIRKHTLLWYCSDNGALSEGSNGGFRGHKAEVYEGGLLVPAILEWPERIQRPRGTAFRCNTSDIYPTVLEATGVRVAKQPPLDGVSLLPLIEGRLDSRPLPMGFWDYPEPGIRTPSQQWMTELLDAQKAGKEPEDRWKLRLDAAEIGGTYSPSSLPGHAAWISGSWKLHRIADKEGDEVRYELYDLSKDPNETTDLYPAKPEIAQPLKTELEQWQHSVVHSLNGEDYQSTQVF